MIEGPTRAFDLGLVAAEVVRDSCTAFYSLHQSLYFFFFPVSDRRVPISKFIIVQKSREN